jgi:hypothetical protein
VAVVETVLGLLLIAFGSAGAFNVHRSRDRIVRINRSRPPGDRARSVAGITAWCGVSVLVGLLLVLHGAG